jgi:hypothetical protein
MVRFDLPCAFLELLSLLFCSPLRERKLGIELVGLPGNGAAALVEP